MALKSGAVWPRQGNLEVGMCVNVLWRMSASEIEGPKSPFFWVLYNSIEIRK